jgi:hypothetical protein
MIGGLWKSTSAMAMFAAAGLFVGGVALPSAAQAADLGGDCCADLEERVAELEATVARKGNRRVSLTISGQVSTAVMAWDAGKAIAPVAAEPAVDPSIKVTTTNVIAQAGIIGQVGAIVLPAQAPAGAEPFAAISGFGAVSVVAPGLVTNVTFDKGKAAVPAKAGGRASDVYIVDNVMSGGTFFQLAGNANINPNVSAGFQVVIALDVGGRSHQVTQFDDDGTDSAAFSVTSRHTGGFDTDIVLTLANWYIDHKQMGRVTMGRINTATAGITTIDLGGAGVISNASFGYTQRAFTDPGSGQTWSNLLGGNAVNGASLSRAQAISYTSPTVGGFTVSGAWGENDVWDVALRFAGEFAGFRVAAGIGYIVNQGGLGDVSEESGLTAGGAEPTQVKGSASVLHVASGLFLTGAYLRQDNDTAGRDDTTLWYLQGGMAKNWTGLGNTVLYGEYGHVENGLDNFANTALVADSDATMWGIGAVQHIDAAAMEAFLSFKQYSADVAGKSPEDFSVVMGGARIRF